MPPPKTLVTGATGFIGSVLTRQLVEAGAAVRIFRRPDSRLDLLGPVADRVEHAMGDLGDPHSLRLAMQGVRHAFHAAALVGVGQRVRRDAMRRVNVEGTAHVVDAARAAGVQRLVFTSSIAALGRGSAASGAGSPVDEDTPWTPATARSDYAQSKRDAELEVHRGIAEGLDAVIVNPALVFGAGRPGEGTRRLVDAARRGRLPAVPTGSTGVVDVEDVAQGHRRALRLGETGERYLLSSENLSWLDVFQTLAEAFGAKPPRRTIAARWTRTAAAALEAVAFLTRTQPLLTRAAARGAARHDRYSARKAVRELGCTFRPFAETAHRIAQTLREAQG